MYMGVFVGLEGQQGETVGKTRKMLAAFSQI